jgi:uncharacterized protein (DUF305 family)
MKIRNLCATAVLLILPACASTQPMQHRPMPQPTNQATADYMREMHAMNVKEHRTPPANETSVDFVNMMIPHHQAAIEMARTYLQYGQDPELRRMSRTIIASQIREIAEMERWKNRHGVMASPVPIVPSADDISEQPGH